jgi:hypothetical protein
MFGFFYCGESVGYVINLFRACYSLRVVANLSRAGNTWPRLIKIFFFFWVFSFLINPRPVNVWRVLGKTFAVWWEVRISLFYTRIPFNCVASFLFFYVVLASFCLLLLLLWLLLTAFELSLGGDTDKTNKKIYTETKQYKKHSTNNTKHRKYKYTYYQN